MVLYDGTARTRLTFTIFKIRHRTPETHHIQFAMTTKINPQHFYGRLNNSKWFVVCGNERRDTIGLNALCSSMTPSANCVPYWSIDRSVKLWSLVLKCMSLYDYLFSKKYELNYFLKLYSIHIPWHHWKIFLVAQSKQQTNKQPNKQTNRNPTNITVP